MQLPFLPCVMNIGCYQESFWILLDKGKKMLRKCISSFHLYPMQIKARSMGFAKSAMWPEYHFSTPSQYVPLVISSPTPGHRQDDTFSLSLSQCFSINLRSVCTVSLLNLEICCLERVWQLPALLSIPSSPHLDASVFQTPTEEQRWRSFFYKLQLY